MLLPCSCSYFCASSFSFYRFLGHLDFDFVAIEVSITVVDLPTFISFIVVVKVSITTAIVVYSIIVVVERQCLVSFEVAIEHFLCRCQRFLEMLSSFITSSRSQDQSRHRLLPHPHHRHQLKDHQHPPLHHHPLLQIQILVFLIVTFVIVQIYFELIVVKVLLAIVVAIIY